MDVPDEHEKSSKPSTSLPLQHISSTSDHIIPQMIITSAEDTSAEQKHVTDCALVLTPSNKGHSTDGQDNNTSSGFTECGNSVQEEKPVIDSEDISIVVRDVVSKCTESVSHSFCQRPLVIEVDKNVQQHEASKDSSSIKCPPPPPPPPPQLISNVTTPPLPLPSIKPLPTSKPVISPPTAVQRPLVFEGAVTKAEPLHEIEKNIPVKESTEIKDDLICNKIHQGIQLTSEHSVEGATPTEECTTPTKKDGLHGVKKFFDSLLHHESQEPGVNSEEQQPPKELDHSPDVSKSGKSVTNIFRSPKDPPKFEQSHSPESQCEHKESSSFAKDAKQNIKSFFDSFKHETVESKDSDEIKIVIDQPHKEVAGDTKSQPSTPDIPKETTSFAKDTKQNIKAFFDTFKHEPSEQKLKSNEDKKSSPVDISSECPNESTQQSSTLESPKESTSFAKETKQNIKAFFGTFKHEPSEQKLKSNEEKQSTPIDISSGCQTESNQQSSTPESPKESTSFAKDTKENIKAFFDTFKHDPSEQKLKSNEEKKSPVDISSEYPTETIQQSSTPESPKESTSFAKETKQNIKAFFGTFKHEPSEQKLKSNEEKPSIRIDISSECQTESNQQSSTLESPKESTSFAKDTKQNIKAFFDGFKQEPSEQKTKSGISKKSISQPNIGEEVDNEKIDYQSSTPENTKVNIESTSFAKDTKHNIKAFFDTFKHETNEQKPKTSITKKSVSQPDVGEEESSEKNTQSSVVGSPKESSFVKDTKHNIKSFFDTFKHESSDIKHKENTCKKSASHSDFTRESKEIDSPLQESSTTSKDKESVSFAKEARQNVKSFFGSFKHESNISKDEDTPKKLEDNQLPLTNEPSYVLDYYGESAKVFEINKEFTSVASRDTEQDTKSVPDTCKEFGGKEISPKKPIASDPNLHKEPSDGRAIPHKDTKHSLKKFFSFKHIGDGNESISPELSGSLDSHLPKESRKDKPLKVSKSVKLDLDPKYSSNGTENMSASYSHMNGNETELIGETKERAQSVPSDALRKDFGIIPEIKMSEDIAVSNLDSPVGSPKEPKDSTRQGFKKFFDSFKHEKTAKDRSSSQSISSKKESTRESSTTNLASGNDESKNTEKPIKDKKGKSIKRSLSDKVSREEVVQNFKGFFDSISHKSPQKKSDRDSEHIYDVVEIKPDMSSPVLPIDIYNKTDTTKSDAQGMKKTLSPFHSKDISKPGFESMTVTQAKTYKTVEETLNKRDKVQDSSDIMKDLSQSTSRSVKDATLSDLSPTVSEPGSPKADKSSVFNTIGENILSLKEKMLHSKEKRKSGLVDDSVKVSDKSLEMDEIENGGIQKSAIPSTSNESNEENIVKAKPIPAEKPKEIKGLPKHQTLKVTDKAEAAEESNERPNSLYDTCCMKIAVLLRDKAFHIVTEHTKSPPPKPPKPSAEAIAKARAAVSRKLAETQKKGRSVGETFPLGCNSMRFADDDTESSCDYKDVENFDYIMDYDLFNRYRLDSNKLDTFSVPSTCSGLTSYYTADTITSRDEIYSDAIMETISLSSDVSYNVKQLASSSKSEPKILSATIKENKSKTDVSGSKQHAARKVPPPIPPKPLILQNISKIKGTSDHKTISQCVNGLSLSPRLQSKFAKDPAAIQKRPLMVADIKGTQFSSLQHPKKSAPQKPIRNFDTILKNESLKIIPCVLSDTISSTTDNQNSSRTDLSSQSSIKVEKRTKSPPRPPPPNISKKPEKPPKPDRPPPPAKSLKNISFDETAEEKCEKVEHGVINELADSENLLEEKVSDLSIQSSTIERSQDSNLLEACPLTDKSQKISDYDDFVNTNKSQSTEIRNNFDQIDLKLQQDNLNNNIEASIDMADSLNNNIEISETAQLENPKPPPRGRRIRSRTVEVVSTERPEERLKRSQSLSEIDVQKRVTFLNEEKAAVDSKSLYTTVNKNGKRPNSERTSQSSPDLVSCRPLPAPPPPPRRFRSLERKGKARKMQDEKVDEQNYNAEQMSTSPAPSEDSIKVPSRRKKGEKQRFFSLHTEHRNEIDIASENLKRAGSVPSRPERKMKSAIVRKYDVNANISSLHRSQEDLNLSNQNIPNVDTTDSFQLSKSKSKDVDSQKRSHSSWYDENETGEDSFEIVDAISSHDLMEEYMQNPKVPLRRKLETKRKSRETSKFYVNMDEETSAAPVVDEGSSPLPPAYKQVSPFPLVDKETSPLPLDCSEKSVQTSLETLSQGIVSHDDQSEDTDDLLDLAQTLQKELSTIINRHKSVNENTEDTPSPPLSAATSEKNLAEDFKEIKKSSSVRSSTSEVWPITSSDESDVERVGEDSSNVNEVAVKRKQKKIFYIAREIMTSEEAFVDALKLLNVDFKAAVEAANKQKNMNIIPDESLAQILNHLPQLQHLNENLLMELKDRIENWDKHEKIADIIVKMGPFLKLYSWYIHDFESNVSLLEECKKRYPAFSQVVKEFEMSARCKRLALNHYMLKPIQRIPQYRLLLQEYLHHLMEDSKDYQDTVAALQIVSEVANHANDSMKHGDNAQKLISIQNSIMGHKEIVKPGRVFVKEGELMKLSRKGMQPRWFVLFNDLLLYLTPVQQGLYRVNHELPLTGMKVAIPIQQDYQNEFSIISVTRSFTLAARSQEERQEWIIALTKAIEENASKRSTFTNSRLNQKAQDKTSSEDEAAFILGKKAPVWIPDARVTMCQLCTSEFTVTFRRHHCRACGKVVCSICSSHRISLPYLGNRIARVCDECHIHLGQGSSACTESGETDSDNQQIAVKSHLRTDNRHLKKNKRMLPSVLKEVCANDQGSSISGYLHKRTGKSWKRDWFVVKDKVLYEYKASEDVAALRSIPLLGYQIELFCETCEGVDSSLLFQLTHPGQAPIVFYADTVGSAERWVSALRTATVLE